MMLSPTSSPRAVRAMTAAAARESPRGTPDLQRRALLGSAMMSVSDIETDKSRVIGELASRYTFYAAKCRKSLTIFIITMKHKLF